MSHRNTHETTFVGIDPEDMTPKQLRMALRQVANIAALKGTRKKGDDEPEDDDNAEEESKENDDLVNLHAEHNGDSKPPKVKKDDLPKGVKLPKGVTEDDDEEEDA